MLLISKKYVKIGFEKHLKRFKVTSLVQNFTIIAASMLFFQATTYVKDLLNVSKINSFVI